MSVVVGGSVQLISDLSSLELPFPENRLLTRYIYYGLGNFRPLHLEKSLMAFHAVQEGNFDGRHHWGLALTLWIEPTSFLRMDTFPECGAEIGMNDSKMAA